MDITEDQIKDATRFSNFAQRVKMAYWEQIYETKEGVPEFELDKILLLAWKDFKKFPSSLS